MMIRVVAVDDHSLILSGLKAEIAKHQDVQLVGTADHGSKFIDLLREHHPHVATLDLGVKGKFDPVATVRAAKKEFPDVKILILTYYDDEVWVRALVDAGASGYMLKSDDFSGEIVKVICALYKGGEFFSPQIAALAHHHNKAQIELTSQEMSILKLLDKGASTKLIAGKLFVSCQRVRGLLVILCKKLDVEKDDGISLRYALVQKARALGLLPNTPMDANLIELLSRDDDDDLA